MSAPYKLPSFFSCRKRSEQQCYSYSEIRRLQWSNDSNVPHTANIENWR